MIVECARTAQRFRDDHIRDIEVVAIAALMFQGVRKFREATNSLRVCRLVACPKFACCLQLRISIFSTRKQSPQ